MDKLWWGCPYCKDGKPLEERTARGWEQKKAGDEWGVDSDPRPYKLINGACISIGQGTEVSWFVLAPVINAGQWKSI